ncbi:S41 family peptidase [Candidatus Parcubacteria bacterium]|nr:S41 family peptidase [Candidatus Parcubacteria bacterium]
MKYLDSKYSALITALILVSVSFFAGYQYAQKAAHAVDQVTVLDNKELNMPPKVDFSPFWTAWNILSEKHVATGSSTNVTDQAKVWGAIQGLASSLNDPYTVFFPPVESKNFASDISGNFEGVGMEIAIQNEILTVVAPLKGSPAQKAGILPGDKVLQINGKTTEKMSVDEAVKTIRGPKGTSVKLTLFRTGKKDPFDINVVRNTIDVPTVETEARKDGIFVLKLYNFYAPSAQQFRNALREFVQSGDTKLILDLRNNPGGYLEAAVDMASWFLPGDKTVVTEDFGGNRDAIVHRSKGYNIFDDKLRMIILVNGGSASASEILSGALKENGIARLVGTKTFGKGTVQEVVPVTGDTTLKVTVARWLTPQGHSIAAVGISPDYEIKISQDDVDKKKDLQMDKAVELLK